MKNITSRKDLIRYLLIEKDYDHQYVFDYLLDHNHYWQTIHSLDVAGKPCTSK